MTAEQAIRAVEESGGWFELREGEGILVRRAPKQLVPVLRMLKPEIIRLLKNRQAMPVVYLDVPCRCDEKPFPHFRHFDGSGPGSGHRLEPENAPVRRGK